MKWSHITKGNFFNRYSSEGLSICPSLWAEQSSTLTKYTYARTCALTCEQSSVGAVNLGCGHIELEQAESNIQHPCENWAQKEASCKDRNQGTESLSPGLQNDISLLTQDFGLIVSIIMGVFNTQFVALLIS